jgi:hypothetical protein
MRSKNLASATGRYTNLFSEKTIKGDERSRGGIDGRACRPGLRRLAFGPALPLAVSERGQNEEVRLAGGKR